MPSDCADEVLATIASVGGLERRALTRRNNRTTIGSMNKDVERLSAKRTAELQRLLSRRGKKAKTSISLSGELLRATDVVAGKAQRSALVERALRSYLKSILRRARHQRDVALIAGRAALTNHESDQVLALQAWPE